MLRERIAEDLNIAMKARDKCAVSTLRLILAALKDRDIAAREDGRDDGIDDDDILKMLHKMVRQRRESVTTYEQAGRLDLAEREAEEIEIIRKYLPRQMKEEEIDAAVKRVIDQIGARGVKDMGRTMATLKKSYPGQMDFSKASGFVRGYLSGV